MGSGRKSYGTLYLDILDHIGEFINGENCAHEINLFISEYSVGYMDIEVPARNPRQFSEIKRHHEHLLKIETVLCAVYYPSSFGSGDGPAPDGGSKKNWSRATWLPRPRLQTTKGYAKFAS